jgi:hypothetical protein
MIRSQADLSTCVPRSVRSHRLSLTFDDGASGTIDLAALIRFDGVFAPFLQADYFAQMWVDPELGTVVWANGAGLCPDVLHATLAGRRPPGNSEAADEPCCG